MHPTLLQSYGERSEASDLTPLATYLLRLMHLKQTNLCLSADVTSTSELLQVAEAVGEHICVLKTHSDIINDFGEKTIRGLIDVSRRKQFVVFEDRKFGDIGNTVQLQYTDGPLSIIRWAAIVNCHIFPGPQIISALSQAAKRAIIAYNTSVQTDISASPAGSVRAEESSEDDDDDEEEEEEDATDEDEEDEVPSIAESDEDVNSIRNSRKQSVVSVSTTISTKTETISPRPSLRTSLSQHALGEDEDEDQQRHAALEDLGPPPFYRSLLLLAQMSSADNYFTPTYTQACLQHARLNKDFVMGFISQESLNQEPGDNFITMTPGVQASAKGDGLGQQYNTPRKVIVEGGTDVIIVGRGILKATDRRKEALEYRKQGWLAYQERLRSQEKCK